MDGEIKVLNHGYVYLDDVMGGDRTAAQKARTSNRVKQEKTAEEDARLTNYLVKNRHTTPLEFCQVRYYMKMPIFVARQIVRHRTATINEISLRYVQATREFYVPALDRMQKQSESNKQGSSIELVEDPEGCREIFERCGNNAFDEYELLIEKGLAKELARSNLPCGTYTEWYWQSDLHNLLSNFLRLRLDLHAQYEVRVYAQAMLELIEPIYPTVIKSWRDAS